MKIDNAKRLRDYLLLVCSTWITPGVYRSRYMDWGAKIQYLVAAFLSSVVLFGGPLIAYISCSIARGEPEEFGAMISVGVKILFVVIFFAFALGVYGDRCLDGYRSITYSGYVILGTKVVSRRKHGTGIP